MRDWRPFHEPRLGGAVWYLRSISSGLFYRDGNAFKVFRTYEAARIVANEFNLCGPLHQHYIPPMEGTPERIEDDKRITSLRKLHNRVS